MAISVRRLAATSAPSSTWRMTIEGASRSAFAHSAAKRSGARSPLRPTSTDTKTDGTAVASGSTPNTEPSVWA